MPIAVFFHFAGVCEWVFSSFADLPKRAIAVEFEWVILGFQSLHIKTD